MMKKFKEYIEELDEKKFEEEELDEGIGATTVGLILGIPTLAALLVWGGSIIVKGYSRLLSSAAVRIRKSWRMIKKAFGKRSEEDILDAIDKNIKDPKVKLELSKSEKNIKRFEQELDSVYEAIENKDFKIAKEEYDKLDKTIKNNPDVIRAVIDYIVKEMKEQPLHLGPTGNETYKAIKKVINIRVAAAAAAASKMALERKMEE